MSKNYLTNLLIDLEKLSKTHYRAKSLFEYYCENGDLSKKQWKFAGALVSQENKSKKPKKESEYYLYCIGHRLHVKIGFTSDVKKRLSQLQTSNAKKLECLWRYHVGKDKRLAQSAERKLHRFCDLYRLSGEWFDKDCISIVRKFNLNR